jgi:hypothetical protein
MFQRHTLHRATPSPKGIPMRGKHIIQWLFDAAAWFVVAIAVLTFALRLRSGSRLLFPITDANRSPPERGLQRRPRTFASILQRPASEIRSGSVRSDRL